MNWRIYYELINVAANLLQNRNGIARHRDRVEGLVLQDSVEDLILVVSAERRLAKQHFVGQDTECPPINGTAVALFKKNLMT
jgi:hypothetical protein